jgi:hypothetical protein
MAPAVPICLEITDPLRLTGIVKNRRTSCDGGGVLAPEGEERKIRLARARAARTGGPGFMREPDDGHYGRSSGRARAKSAMTAGEPVSKPTTSSMPASFGSAMLKPFDSSPTTTSLAGMPVFSRYSRSAWAG